MSSSMCRGFLNRQHSFTSILLLLPCLGATRGRELFGGVSKPNSRIVGKITAASAVTEASISA